MKGDPHNHKQRIKNCEKNLKEADITEENKEILLEFLNYLKGQGLSQSRITSYINRWRYLLENVDIDFDILEAEKKDLRELVGLINQNQVKDRDLAESTLREYKKCINKMYKDFLQETRDFPGEDMTDFFTLTISSKKTDPERLPTPQTVKELISNCQRLRDRAFIATLWSSGGRISEVLGLQWKNLNFKPDVVRVTFEETKTGDKRVVPLRAGLTYLRDLKEQDKQGSDMEAYVFRKVNDNGQMPYSTAKNIIYNAEKRSDIPERKKVNPHAFRKGRATYLAAKGMNQATICEYFGWAQGSKEAAKYIRMAESDVENSVKEIAGLEDSKTSYEEDLNPVKCYECGTLNSFEADTCKECGSELTTSKFYEEQQISEIEDQITTELALGQLDYDEEDIQEKAKELYKEKFNDYN